MKAWAVEFLHDPHRDFGRRCLDVGSATSFTCKTRPSRIPALGISLPSRRTSPTCWRKSSGSAAARRKVRSVHRGGNCKSGAQGKIIGRSPTESSHIQGGAYPVARPRPGQCGREEKKEGETGGRLIHQLLSEAFWFVPRGSRLRALWRLRLRRFRDGPGLYQTSTACPKQPGDLPTD